MDHTARTMVGEELWSCGVIVRDLGQGVVVYLRCIDIHDHAADLEMTAATAGQLGHCLLAARDAALKAYQVQLENVGAKEGA